VNLQVKGLTEVRQKLTGLPKQIQFATMQAINDTAVAVQKFEVEKQLPSKFTLRSRGAAWWKPGSRYGINIRFASKAKLIAIVGSLADWLKLQEEGGIRRTSGHRLAIESGARPNERSVLPAAVKPRVLLRQAGQSYKTRKGIERTAKRSGKGFEMNTKSGPAIFTRDGGGLKLMYMLKASARIPAILNFFLSAKTLVETTYQQTFNKRLSAALQTAKK